MHIPLGEASSRLKENRGGKCVALREGKRALRSCICKHCTWKEEIPGPMPPFPLTP